MLAIIACGYASTMAWKAKSSLADVLWGPVFEPLQSVPEFAKLCVDPEWSTLVWPNGADLAPESLHKRLKSALAKSQAAE